MQLRLQHGLVAQLGAHHIRIVGVGSSNLLKSTRKKHLLWQVLFSVKSTLTGG